MDGDDEDGTKRFQLMCIILSANLEGYSGIWNDLKNITLLGTDNYPKTTKAACDLLCCYNKPAPPLQVHAPPAAVIFFQSGDTETIIKHQGMMGYPFQKLHAIASRRQEIMMHIAHHQQPKSTLEHSHYKWTSP